MNKITALALFGLVAICVGENLRTFPQNIDHSPCDAHPLCHYQGYGNWRHLGRAQAEQEHTVVFAVKLSENAADTCDSVLRDISTPGNAAFGKHLNLEEVWKLLSDRRSAANVLDWLSGFDLISVDPGITQDFIKVKASVAVIEQMLQTELHTFQRANGKIITRASAYSLPEQIALHIDHVGNIVAVPNNLQSKISISAPTGADGLITPYALQQYYNINVQKVSKKSSQAVFEADDQNYSPQDLFTFQSTFAVEGEQVDNQVGGNDPEACDQDPNNCGEANLDVQYILAIAPGSNMTYWSIANDVDDPFYNWIIALSQDPNPPLVHSISYGSMSPEDPATDVFRFNTEVCKLALRGVTVVVASGDDGVANYGARTNSSACGFTASFPATSPYVVAVGATSGPELAKKEVACSSKDGSMITTGGGFSYFFPRPQYQDNVVTNYLKNGPKIPPLSMFNSTGRAYPDVALVGVQYQVIIASDQYSVAGTSCSTPVFAGMLTIINDLRIQKGKSSLGWVTPMLYSIAAESGQNVFHDITSGENNCCASDDDGDVVCCEYGFTATTGWDPLTGLGSVNFKNLADRLVNM